MKVLRSGGVSNLLNKAYKLLKKIRPLRFLVILTKQHYYGFKLNNLGMRIIIDLNNAFSEFDNSLFIPAYGALLGLYRDGKFIKHDSDLDLFYISEMENFSTDGFRLIKSLIAKYYGTRAYNFEYIEKHNKVKVLIDNIPVDIHIAVKANISEHITLKHNLRIINLTKFLVLGQEIMIPSNTEQLLIELYGKNWQIPDKTPYSSAGKWPFSD